MRKTLERHEIDERLKKISNWGIIENHHIAKKFKFEDFRQALSFVNKIGEISEKMHHHPDIYISYGNVELNIFTHSINALTKKDFELALEIDKVHGILINSWK